MIMVYVMNLILKFSSSAQTAYGLFYKVQQFVLFLAFGLRDAITPIIAFSYGMGSKAYQGWNQIRADLYDCTYDPRCADHGNFPGCIWQLYLTQGQENILSEQCTLFLSAFFCRSQCRISGNLSGIDGGIESFVISLLRQLVIILPLAGIFSIFVRNG